jgi:hypothetical protein
MQTVSSWAIKTLLTSRNHELIICRPLVWVLPIIPLNKTNVSFYSDIKNSFLGRGEKGRIFGRIVDTSLLELIPKDAYSQFSKKKKARYNKT